MNNNPFEKENSRDTNPFESSGKKNNTSQKNNTYNKEYSSKMEKNISSIKEENIKKIKKENVNNHSLKNKNSQVKNRRKLIIIVGIIIAIIFSLYYVWPPKIEESIKDGKEVYTIKNVGGKRQRDYDYWTFTVGEDIPEGIYSTKVLEGVHINIEMPYKKNPLEKFNTRIYFSSFYLDEKKIDTIPLADGMEVVVSAYNNQDIEFIKEEKQSSLDLDDLEKLGIYKTEAEKLKVPVNRGKKMENEMRIYTLSDDKLIEYRCVYNTCYKYIYVEGDDVIESEKEISELVKEDDDFFTLDLLDDTYVQVTS